MVTDVCVAAASVLTAIAPLRSPIYTAVNITLTGTSLVDPQAPYTLSCTVNNTNVPVTLVSTTQIICAAPPAGQANVTVTVANNGVVVSAPSLVELYGPTFTSVTPLSLLAYTGVSNGVVVEADVFSSVPPWRCVLVCTSGICLSRLEVVPNATHPIAVASRVDNTHLQCNVPNLPPGVYSVHVHADDMFVYEVPVSMYITVLTPTATLLQPAHGLALTDVNVTVSGQNIPQPSTGFALVCHYNFTTGMCLW